MKRWAWLAVVVLLVLTACSPVEATTDPFARLFGGSADIWTETDCAVLAQQADSAAQRGDFEHLRAAVLQRERIGCHGIR